MKIEISRKEITFFIAGVMIGLVMGFVLFQSRNVSEPEVEVTLEQNDGEYDTGTVNQLCLDFSKVVDDAYERDIDLPSIRRAYVEGARKVMPDISEYQIQQDLLDMCGTDYGIFR